MEPAIACTSCGAHIRLSAARRASGRVTVPCTGCGALQSWATVGRKVAETATPQPRPTGEAQRAGL